MTATVICDIDGVLADTHSVVIEQINKRHNLNIKYTDIDEWDKCFGKIRFITEYRLISKKQDLILGIPIIKGALEAMKLLESMGFHLIIATGRWKDMEDITIEWLKPFPYRELIFTHDKHKIDADFLIDDYTKKIYSFVQRQDRIGILFSRPWNILGRGILEKYREEGLVFYPETWAEIVSVLTGWTGVEKHDISEPQ